jgi:2-keto-4-pentenoate hydratase/2-oxohepta-3-ene-1,7-dioic acid hydratase in catechol pathway
MKLVLFQPRDQARPGALTRRGVVDLSEAVAVESDPQRTMVGLIDQFEELREDLERLADTAPAVDPASVRLLAPLPRPGKILCCAGNYWEHAEREPKPLRMFMKNPDAVIGPGGTVELPRLREPWMFMHEAELAVVIKGPAKEVEVADWRSVVFGYTALVDVSARGDGRVTWKRGGWLGKSFDTFCPIGPCLVTADELPDPNALAVRFWDNDQLRHDYNTNDMEHGVDEIVAFASSIMTLYTGDVLACGTNHEGLGPIQDGERLRIDIAGIGAMDLTVHDPLGRSWPRGVYLGADSTNRAAAGRRGTAR